MELLLEAVKYNYSTSGIFVGTSSQSLWATYGLHCCFLCLWDSRDVAKIYKQKDWSSRHSFVPGEHSVQDNPLVDMIKVLLPPLHIKVGLVKNFVTTMDKSGAAFQH